MQIHHIRVDVVRGGVLEQDVEAVVNAANPSMQGGGGVDCAIHRAAGKALMEELIEVAPHGAKTGTAVIIGGHQIRKKSILHTPGPTWKGGGSGEQEKLAFCSLSTGIYGYPLDRAAPIAVQATADYLKAYPGTSLERVVFAMYREQGYTL